jgi:hypothetical protein
MSFLRMRCPASGTQGWPAWLPAIVLLVVIAFQLIDRASDDTTAGTRPASDAAGEIDGSER